MECCGKRIVVVYNGIFMNFFFLRKSYENRGVRFYYFVDFEFFGILFFWYLNEIGDEFEVMREVFNEVKGVYLVVLFFDGKIFVVRDFVGFRFLSYGIGDGYYFVSEDLVLRFFVDEIEGGEIRDVWLGEVFLFLEGSVESRVLVREKYYYCVFEYIYFVWLDSIIDGVNVYYVRVKMGREFVRESFVDVDVVIVVFDFGRVVVLGFLMESGIFYLEGLIKNCYIGRIFIIFG